MSRLHSCTPPHAFLRMCRDGGSKIKQGQGGQGPFPNKNIQRSPQHQNPQRFEMLRTKCCNFTKKSWNWASPAKICHLDHLGLPLRGWQVLRSSKCSDLALRNLGHQVLNLLVLTHPCQCILVRQTSIKHPWKILYPLAVNCITSTSWNLPWE